RNRVLLPTTRRLPAHPLGVAVPPSRRELGKAARCDRSYFFSSQSLFLPTATFFRRKPGYPIPSMPQITVTSIFSRLDHAGPNSSLSRAVIQMLHETTPARRRVRTLCHGQPFLRRQPDGSTTWRYGVVLRHAAPEIITHTSSPFHPH